MKKALLLVNLQKDFCKNGSLEINGSSEVIEIANKIMKIFSRKKYLIIAVKKWYSVEHQNFAENFSKDIEKLKILDDIEEQDWPVHCVENTRGAEFHEKLSRKYINKVIYRRISQEMKSYSCFFNNHQKDKTELSACLTEEEVQELYIMGFATDYCVKYTICDALKMGYKVWFIEDGSKGINRNSYDSEESVEEMKKRGALLIKSLDIK